MPGAPRRGGQGGGERRERRDDRRGGQAEKQNVYLERVVTINRVAKVVKGGRRFSFTALVIVGDGNGMVGVGYGKAKEVPAAIAKGVEEARKGFFRVPLIGGTVTHPVQGEAAAAVNMVRSISSGTGGNSGGAGGVVKGGAPRTTGAIALARDTALLVVPPQRPALKFLRRTEGLFGRRGLVL